MTERVSSRFASWSARSQILGVILSLVAVGAIAAVVANGSRSAEATIPAGTRLVAALEHTVSTEYSDVGEAVELRTVEPLKLAEGDAIPEGVVIRGEVTHSKGGGRIAGAPALTLRFIRLHIDGREYSIAADPFRVRGKDDLTESVAEIGGGAVVGGIVGAVAGDVLKGAVVGAVLGTGVAVATKGGQIVLPAGQKLRIRLAEGVTVRYDPERTQSGEAHSSSKSY